MSRRTGPIAAAAAALRRRVWLARAALAWERLWPALWPATLIAGLFLAAALFDPWTLMPGWLHAAVLALFGAAFVGALGRAATRIRAPTEAEAIRRIERASGLEHRPLEALGDRPAAAPGDRTAERLWGAHLERMARAARRLRVGVASPGLASRDPLALRAVLLLVLIVAATAAGGDGASRLARAFQPDLSGLGGGGPAELDLWITPPAYTGAPPVFLATGPRAEPALQPAEVTVPSGSVVLARVRGGRAVPRLEIGDEQIPFTTVEGANYELRTTLTKGRRLAVVQGADELAAWPLSVIADKPPVIEFAAPPARTHRAALRLDYLAEDDYGLASIEATIRRADDPGQSFTVDPPLPRVGATSAREISFHDLTSHPWAGLPVTITLGAVDAVGQSGASDAVATVLPERIFNHPVARAVIEQRKALTLDPTKRVEVSLALYEISREPQKFFEDLTVFLALRVARWRLLYDDSAKATAEIQDLLWDLALTIEEGPLALAERDLREAQQALLDALAGEAPDEEIERLTDALLAALDEFLDALVARAMEQQAFATGLEEQLLQALRRDDLVDLIERVRELSRIGARDAARQLLSQIQQALENIRLGGFPAQQDLTQGDAMLRDLGRLIEQQQELLDQTFRRAQGAGQPRDDGWSGGARQQELRRGLGEVMRGWSETGIPIPRPLGRAEQAMRDAGRALGQNLPGQAVGPQSEAIDQMQQGAQAMIEGLLRQLGQGSPQPSNFLGLFGGARDPLGRNAPGRGYNDDGRTRVPDEADVQRSRAILEELYRRANDFDRPALERDYIRRLLRRF